MDEDKDRENEKVSNRPGKLNEKKSDRELKGKIKNKGEIFFVGITT